jgi:hypothetical protein
MIVLSYEFEWTVLPDLWIMKAPTCAFRPALFETLRGSKGWLCSESNSFQHRSGVDSAFMAFLSEALFLVPLVTGPPIH